jgi:hypothetical protein
MFLSRLNNVQYLRLSLKNACGSVTRAVLHKILTTTFLVETPCNFDTVTNVSYKSAASFFRNTEFCVPRQLVWIIKMFP